LTGTATLSQNYQPLSGDCDVRGLAPIRLMEVHVLEREFLYNGVNLPDTTPTMTPEQVRETYTHLYPEIATAAIEGPETVAGKLVYKFVRAIGAKG
jgi:PRTRC genetic system protein C